MSGDQATHCPAAGALAELSRPSAARGALKTPEIDDNLGVQAGEPRIRDVVTAAGFTRFRRATETGVNLIFEARP